MVILKSVHLFASFYFLPAEVIVCKKYNLLKTLTKMLLMPKYTNRVVKMK